MTFTITFDYRFDASGFFDNPHHRAVLEEAAALWSGIIRDEFDDLPAGISFDLRNPSGPGTRSVTLTEPVDDVVIFVGAYDLGGSNSRGIGIRFTHTESFVIIPGVWQQIFIGCSDTLSH